MVDFGLARRGVARDATLTQSGALMGTPAYMAPEQARGRIESVGPHSDGYSVGVILYQLLTGRLPFHGDFLAVLGQVMSADAPDPPSTHQPELDPQLEAICLKAMANRPEDRYASMADFAQALTELLKSGRLSGRGASDPAGRARRGSPEFAGRGSPDPALAADRQVSPTGEEAAWPSTPTLMDADGASGRPAVAKVARSGDRPQPRPVERLQRMPRFPRRLWIATACGAAAVLLGIILYVQANHGFVKIELSDPAAKVQVQVDGETIAITGLDRPLRLQPGEFCAKLSELPQEKQAGRQYRLPTEAEWEYACRAGSTSRYGFDETNKSLGNYAWYTQNSGSKTHPIGQKKPNAWGLYDIHGNVYEWCVDWHGTYDASSVDDPRGSTAGSYRVLRGGCWFSAARGCRSAYRLGITPGYRNYDVGFRVALSSVDAPRK